MIRYIVLLSCAALLLLNCHQTETPKNKTLFTALPADQTGIAFRNDLVYDREFNVYRYRNFYNGGGVAIGDINNDGLPDVFFTSNMASNKLYLNKGNMQFEDVSKQAGIEGKGSWSTGVSMADIDGDGWLDIYVCNSGKPRADEKSGSTFNRDNELFINQKNGTFVEKAVEYGLNDRGLGTHAAFFDYDRDGDLDMYMLNNSFQPTGSFDLRKNLRATRDSLGGHKLYENLSISDQQPAPGAPIFKDVSTEAGILGSVIAFGLGVTVGDLNMDGWQDIYVSNDFFERDYLYYNTGNKRFSENLEGSMRHISAASMGADMADINNDALPDIFVTDMLPEPDYRIKTVTSFDSPDRFRFTSSCGYYNQFTRNMLQLNNGHAPATNGNQVAFSDIACLASAEATDWSWGALMFDMDNDGWKDIFVANGVAQDLTNQDYLMFAADPSVKEEIIGGGSVDFKRLIDSIPSEPQPNYAFKNNGDLSFKNMADAWGLGGANFSNGAAYGDLDNDGDLDLVVNCINSPALVYRNDAVQTTPNYHYLKFELHGQALNTAAFGAKIYVKTGGKTYYQEQMPMRGFQSSMDPRPNFGLGAEASVDTVLIEWPNATSTLMTQVPANQTLRLNQQDANVPEWVLTGKQKPQAPIFKNHTTEMSSGWQHQESKFYDWDRDRLLFFQYSTEGPRIAKGDVNGDGREDFFVCGAAGQAGAICIQQANGQFLTTRQPALLTDAASEDVDAALFDADGDHDLDLYVASGSNEMEPMSPQLSDRLYLNDGKGNFKRDIKAIPEQKPYASACVRAADMDGDGDIDLFAGMRLFPGKVGVPVGGFLLINDGHGHFNMQAPEMLRELGLPTDAIWTDLDSDGDPDLVICGEWMPVKMFKNETRKNGPVVFKDITAEMGLSQTGGLWKRIGTGDFNGDGRPDFLVGNMGLNSRLDASPEQPLTMYFNDFDKNGTPEQLLCRYNFGLLLPYALRGDLVGNLPALKKKYLKFGKYANQQPTDIFTPEQMKDGIELKAGLLANSVVLSQPNGTYLCTPLPNEGQFAPIYGVSVGDFDGDGLVDAITGGNFLGAKPEFGFMDADYGLFLKGDGAGHFRPMRTAQTGLFFEGEIRDIQTIQVGARKVWLVARNNAGIEFWTK